MMKGKIISEEIIKKFKTYLCEEEKSENTKEKYFRIIFAICSPACFTALKRTLQNSLTFSVIAVLTQQEFISFQLVPNTGNAWNKCD